MVASLHAVNERKPLTPKFLNLTLHILMCGTPVSGIANNNNTYFFIGQCNDTLSQNYKSLVNMNS